MARSRSTQNRPQSPFPADGPPLAFLLASVGFGTGYRFRELLASTGMQPREFAVLRQVAADQGISQQACGHVLKVAPSQMVAIVDALEDKGYVERRPDPADRRVRALFVTTKGEKALASGIQAGMKNEATLFASFTEAERSEFRRMLQIVAEKLGLEPGQHPGMSQD